MICFKRVLKNGKTSFDYNRILMFLLFKPYHDGLFDRVLMVLFGSLKLYQDGLLDCVFDGLECFLQPCVFSLLMSFFWLKSMWFYFNYNFGCIIVA
ncbi:hypothetical protein HanRHA438_Chr09g0421301 [Helianthus annuus]|nr:hypothetical protein HanRHA438_Chr09g0421301 [Helianthus annuus]